MIKIRRLYKTYHHNNMHPFHALHNINLHVDSGQCIVLNGVSGSGKSTLLSIIAAMDKPTSGEVIVNSIAVNKLPDLHASAYRAHHIGSIFQHFNLLESLSVAENILLPLLPQNYTQKSLKERLVSAMKRAHITHKRDAPVHQLSGGEKQRCAIARALVNDPELILCDEPTANLDADNTDRFIETLQELSALGKTMIIATHDPAFEHLNFVNRTLHIRNGHLHE